MVMDIIYFTCISFIFIPFCHKPQLFASDRREMESVLLQLSSQSVEVPIVKALAVMISLPQVLQQKLVFTNALV